MRAEIELTSFTKGELSPRLKGRIDFKGYFDGCEALLNFVVLPQGGATRRPGTIYANNVKNQAAAPALIPFQFSTTQAYMLEFGASYIRVYRNGGQVTNPQTVTGAANNGSGLIRLAIASTVGMYTGNTSTVAGILGTTEANGTWVITVIDGTHIDLQGSAFANAYVSGGTATITVEIPTPYTAADVAGISITQSADTLYLFHPLYPPRTLGRSSHTNWTLSTIVFLDGPYLNTNTTATTLALSGVSGSVTVTASSIVGINGDQGFKSTDVGRLIRFQNTTWAWLIITAFTDTTHVTATVQSAVNNGAGTIGAGTATAVWRLGKWSDTTGWPWLPTFWQQRLMAAATNNQPNAIEASQTADFTNFAPTKNDGTVIDTNALSWIVSDDQVNAARWISAAGSAQAMQLAIGTDNAEEIMQAATTSQALTPTSVQVYRETTYGSVANCNALRIGKAILFANAAGRKVYEWQFNWQVNGFAGADKTVNSEHITRGILKDMVYQKNPYGVVWCILNDGSLVGLTYLPEQDVIAWHRHRLGGDYYSGQTKVEAISCIPSPDGSYDQLWLATLRTVNGVAVRMIEVLSPYFDGAAQDQAIFMDASLSSTLVFPAATLAASALSGTGTVFTASAGTPFASGDVGSLIRYNGGLAIVRTFTDTTHVIADWYISATSLAPQVSGLWSLTPQHSSFSGVSHLIGQTVQILGDGADMGTKTVSGGGGVTLGTGDTASYATIGLLQPYQLIAMPFEPIRAAQATTQGKTKRMDTLWLRLHESLGCNVGVKQTDPYTQLITHPKEPLVTRSAGDVVGQPPPLFSGLYRLKVAGGYDQEGQLEISGSGPYPLTILAMVAKGDVGEMPGP